MQSEEKYFKKEAYINHDFVKTKLKTEPPLTGLFPSSYAPKIVRALVIRSLGALLPFGNNDSILVLSLIQHSKLAGSHIYITS